MGSNNCISLRTRLAGGCYLFHEVRDHDTVILTASMCVAINLRSLKPINLLNLLSLIRNYITATHRSLLIFFPPK